jgi:histidine triad (HIT) family protein
MILVIRMDCIFCKIIAGEIPSYKIFDDDKVMVFLDINPVNPGHTLIIPKEHTLDISTIDNDVLVNIIEVSRKISKLLTEALGADGYTLTQNNGIAQEVKHFHLHVIPKYSKKLKMDVEEVYNKLKDYKIDL